MLCHFCFTEHDEYCIALDNCRLAGWLNLLGVYEKELIVDGVISYGKTFTISNRLLFNWEGIPDQWGKKRCYIKTRQFLGSMGMEFQNLAVNYCLQQPGWAPETISQKLDFARMWEKFRPYNKEKEIIRPEWNLLSRLFL